MKTIQLFSGQLAIVDESDYEWLRKWKWFLHSGRYAARNGHDGEPGIVMMHRVINATPEGMQTDHINGNGLDNRRSNLRTATDQENKRNKGPQSNNTTGFRGVVWHKGGHKFMAYVKHNNRQVYLGLYDHREEAAGIALTAALEIHGKFVNPSVRLMDARDE